MPNTSVRAAAEGMPKFNRTAIMTQAWTIYRRTIHSGPFNRSTFAFYLACAWDAARMAVMTPAQRRVDALRKELVMLTYKPARIDIIAREQAIKAELATLAA